MSGSRGFFYDDCRSADRLAREYTRVSAGEDLVVEYQPSIGKFAYVTTKTTATTRREWFIKSISDMPTFECYYLFSKNYQAPSQSYGGFGITYWAKDQSNLNVFEFSDAVYFVKFTSGLGPYGEWFTYPVIPVNDSWYHVRFRRNVSNLKMKMWLYGTAEPDWQRYVGLAPAGSNENPPRPVPYGHNIGLTTFLFQNGDYCKIADLRITPIRKVGGP